ncbi:hypothetical protein K2173_026944 [Erythroxylum novogranatense]|uniref:Uncharacterized protein n=1 Tax=Erythroxylum novogranatense TaxID=1862640 RepID=A0AAV8TXV6_9ROSI|nr:hypothetical protein K2173_026944 [Erythroxylum novogranatense]
MHPLTPTLPNTPNRLDPPQVALSPSPPLAASVSGLGPPGSKPVTWKDKVLNRERSKAATYDAKERFPVDLLESGIVTREYKDDNKQFPIFHVDPAYMESLEASLRQSVVVKLLGRPISFRDLYSKIEQLWKPLCGFDVLDLGHDY